MSVGSPSGLERACPKCGALQQSPGSTVCEGCGTDLMPAGVPRPPSPRPVPPPSPRPVPQSVRLLQERIQRLRRGIAGLLREAISFTLRVVTALLRLISLTLRVATVLLLLGALIIGLGFVPEVNTRVPGLKTLSEAALKEVSRTGKRALQRMWELGSGLLLASKSDDQAQRPTPSSARAPQTSTPKAAQKSTRESAQKSAPARPPAVQPFTVKSTPSGATVLLNARRVGKTPLTLRVAPGTYKVTVSRPGYVSVTRTITVKAGESASLNVTLAAAP